ncbi:Acyl dehydratase [Beijerinckiaceae bacterium RH AL1]|nr:MaoC family dehydratase [Beijerinckiaceae bacterium]VVB48857.1 Acyl dehydratase [Beijerinckiaceae bacterium RH CH11]VVB48934.1 Acyl dehydratase [Beijerinckiaceae bacterium RH AL8]VVC56602.1 Acyl dehydratase [Beijerinckiaceae bacterium RH AL1]
MSAPIARGDQLAPRSYGPFEAADLEAYAAASLDDNPLHLDPAIAAKAGLAAPPIHGMLIMACLEPYVRAWRPDASVAKIAAKFVEPVLADETFEITGKVVQAAPGAPAVLRLTARRGTTLVCLAEAFVAVPPA